MQEPKLGTELLPMQYSLEVPEESLKRAKGWPSFIIEKTSPAIRPGCSVERLSPVRDSETLLILQQEHYSRGKRHSMKK